MRGRHHITAVLALAAGLVLAGGCNSDFGHVQSRPQLVVTITGGDPGKPEARVPLSVTDVRSFTVKVVAQRADGSIDTDFNGYVRASVKPGTVAAVSGPNTDGRNALLTAGVADGIRVDVLASYGNTRIWFEDIGYVPADPARVPPPQCSDGIDNNHNTLVDALADPGCAYANDDTEDGGTYESGVSEVLYFQRPRIADVRGVSEGGTHTSFPHDQIEMDTGLNIDAVNFDFNTVITRVAADGFYVSDLGDPRGFSSVFAFTFTSPPNLRVCDRLKAFSGTSSDFFGFTEINYPTWLIDPWDPAKRDCLVPEPRVLSLADIADTGNVLFSLESSLVRVLTSATTTVHISAKNGPKFPAAPDYLPTQDATDCDLNRDGKVSRTDPAEGTCAKACDADAECTEYSNFVSRSEFNLVVTDVASSVAIGIQANAGTAPQFDPQSLRGQPIKSFSGTLRYFSGGTKFTLEARCADDIVQDLNATPPPSNKACATPRTILDQNQSSQ